MRTIHKVTFPIGPGQPVSVTHVLPANAKILSAQEQHGNISIWYEFEEYEAGTQALFSFRIFGTGLQLPHDHFTYTFLSTVQFRNGALVLHLFYRKL